MSRQLSHVYGSKILNHDSKFKYLLPFEKIMPKYAIKPSTFDMFDTIQK